MFISTTARTSHYADSATEGLRWEAQIRHNWETWRRDRDV